jgi:hypothetical protein
MTELGILCPVRLTPMKIDPTPGGRGVPRLRVYEVCNIDISSGIFSAKGPCPFVGGETLLSRTPKSKIAASSEGKKIDIDNADHVEVF